MIPTTPSKPWHCNPCYHRVTASTSEFQQVAEWYQHHPIPGLTLKKVEVIHNPLLAHLFERHIDLLEQQHESPSFKPNWAAESKTDDERKQREETLALLEKKAGPFKDDAHPHVTIVPLWHGTKKENLPKLFKTGFADLATTGSSLFGKGIYNAGEAEYAYRVYSQEALLINWVAVYSVFPVLREDMKSLTGKGNYQNYDGHFIPLAPKDPHEATYFPCKPGEKHVYTELVVFEPAQVLPGYLVELQPELSASPPGMGHNTVPTPSLNVGELLMPLLKLLDDPLIQHRSSLCQYLQSKVDILRKLPESTPLEAEDDKLLKLVKQLLAQEKEMNSVLDSILKIIATNGSPGGSRELYDWAAQPVSEIKIRGHSRGITTFIELRDGTLASASWDRTIKLWRRDGTCIRTLEEHCYGIEKLIELSDGTLVSWDWDRRVKFWGRDGTYLREIILNSYGLGWYGLHANIIELKDGVLVFASTGDYIELWKRDGTSLQVIGQCGIPRSGLIVELKDGTLAEAIGNDIYLWKRDETLLQILKGHEEEILSLIQLQDGTLASASRDTTIKLWRRNRTCLRTLWGHTGAVGTLIQLQDGTLASKSSDGIKLWKLDGTCLRTLGTDPISSFIQLRDGTLAAATDNIIKLWSQDGTCLQTLKIEDAASFLVQLRDGTLAASSDTTIYLWKFPLKQ